MLNKPKKKRGKKGGGLSKYIDPFDSSVSFPNQRARTPKLRNVRFISTWFFPFFPFSQQYLKKMSDLVAPVLPDHVKKPNEEEYKKSLEQVNANIEKIQKQFVSYSVDVATNLVFLHLTFDIFENIGCCSRKNCQIAQQEW